jgi:tellurite resistance protein TehA-like permease
MAAWRRLSGILSRASAELFPGYFSLVMATGALSIANQLLGHRPIALLLLAVNVVAYAVLVLLFLLRLWRFFPRVVRDMTNHAVGPGFFTLVAGTCVFGTQLIVVAGAPAIAHWLWLLGLVLWVVIMYGFFFAVTVREHKPTLALGINGAWLIASVATQAVSVLGTLAAPTFGASHEIVRFVALCMYLLGAMLYLAIITLIFYRFTFVKVTVESMTPPYWINMGAVAISTLAGATLMLHADAWGFIGELLPFIKGFTLFFWVTATWWIPLLVALMTWRHVWRRHPILYDPQFWGMVFPLAMYTTATFQLAKAEHLDFLVVIPEGFVFVALAAWLLAFAGLLRSIARGTRTVSVETAVAPR